MTVIAYRDGVMAADTSGWIGRFAHRWSEKLFRAPDGTLYGICGEASEGQAYLAWLRDCNGRPEPMPRDVGGSGSFGVIRVGRCGVIWLLDNHGGWERFDAPYYAYGGGQGPAWGALYAGASAEVAVHAAIEHSDAAKGDVRTISHLETTT